MVNSFSMSLTVFIICKVNNIIVISSNDIKIKETKMIEHVICKVCGQILNNYKCLGHHIKRDH